DREGPARARGAAQPRGRAGRTGRRARAFDEAGGRRGAAPARRAGSGAGEAVVAGVAITHPSRVIDAGSGVTKLELARLYASMAEWMLPHVVDRPLMLLRCPEGTGGPCFHQK